MAMLAPRWRFSERSRSAVAHLFDDSELAKRAPDEYVWAACGASFKGPLHEHGKRTRRCKRCKRSPERSPGT